MTSTDTGSSHAAPESEVVAAGAVVVRRRNGGEVLVVHRPKYDDWAWPKGKREAGEHVTATAVREVLEETGVAIRLGRPLPDQRYLLLRGRAKRVHYWTGRAVGGANVSGYVANDEIDQVAWIGMDKARRLLSYADDVALLDEVRRHPRRTNALVVLRHASAVKRAAWDGADSDPPRSAPGERGAEAQAPVLAAYGVTRVVSSDSWRCRRTVLPYADAHGLAIEAETGLDEQAWSPESVTTIVEDLLESRKNAVLCSHRPVLPAVLAAAGLEEDPLAAGEMLVCHHRKGRVVAVERHLV
jgi:8-oxo-dGTP diphosphatase